MDRQAARGTAGYRAIGSFKLASAALLAAAGFGIFRLMDGGLGESLTRTVTRLHLDPENRLIHGAIARVTRLDPTRLRQIGVGTFFFAALEAVEGVGLSLRRRWAGYLTVVATGVFLPLEVYEIAHKANPIRVAVFLTNLGIVAYLVVRLREELRADHRAP